MTLVEILKEEFGSYLKEQFQYDRLLRIFEKLLDSRTEAYVERMRELESEVQELEAQVDELYVLLREQEDHSDAQNAFIEKQHGRIVHMKSMRSSNDD